MNKKGPNLSGHPDFIEEFDAALRGGPLPAGLTARDGKEVKRRFDVYRNNVAVSLTGALALRFPVIQRLVGEAFFGPLARLYSATERPMSPVLAEWGDGFPAFLAGFPPLAGLPYLADVARIELARGRAFHAADAAPLDPACLAAADPIRVRLILHPSVSLLSLSYPAVAIWARNQPGGAAFPLANGPETALILRDAAFQVPVRSVTAGDAALLRSVMDGATLSEAAIAAQQVEANHDPTPMLVSLMQAGVIADVKG